MTGAKGTSPVQTGEELRGIVFVTLSAVTWSFGGAIARFLDVADPWTVVFWRSASAFLFLACFMLWRDGARGTVRLFLEMGLPGLFVGLCFATASTSFIVALQYTTVANILLMGAGVPLIAAAISWLFFREHVTPATWAAIAAVIAGVAVMVSDSLSGKVSPVGDGLALVIALAFASATVTTRRRADLRMTPAVCFGTVLSAGFASILAGGFAVAARDGGLLFLFGAANLGLGLALFVTGARLVPSAIAALIGTIETILGPFWVWLAHNETPTARTVAGGGIILAALLAHIFWQIRQQHAVRMSVPGP